MVKTIFSKEKGIVEIPGEGVSFEQNVDFEKEVKFNKGINGSLTKLNDGSPFLIAGNNINIVTQSNGSVLISAESITELTAGPGVSVNNDGQVSISFNFNEEVEGEKDGNNTIFFCQKNLKLKKVCNFL